MDKINAATPRHAPLNLEDSEGFIVLTGGTDISAFFATAMGAAYLDVTHGR